MTEAVFYLNINLKSEANLREHWAVRDARHKKYLKQLITIKPAIFKINLPCEVELTRIAPRMLDSHDNLPCSFKYVVDQLSSWLIGDKAPGRADSDPRIKWSYSQKKSKTPREYAVMIKIREV